MKLSIVIPAHNEAESLPETIRQIASVFDATEIQYEILVVDDNSTDNTIEVLAQHSTEFPMLRFFSNEGPNGFGHAVRLGLSRFSGDCVAIMMADLSDSPEDLLRFYRKMIAGNYDCVFGSRFIRGGTVADYPFVKKIINRIANTIIMIAMQIRYNDTTNAFKLYKREVIEGIKPILSPHFNLTIELPLKAIIRGYTYAVEPNSWKNRKHGVSKLKIKEMGSRYFFILVYCFIEKYFSRGDFRRRDI